MDTVEHGEWSYTCLTCGFSIDGERNLGALMSMVDLHRPHCKDPFVSE